MVPVFSQILNFFHFLLKKEAYIWPSEAFKQAKMGNDTRNMVEGLRNDYRGFWTIFTFSKAKKSRGKISEKYSQL
jgi:hypothetical protein